MIAVSDGSGKARGCSKAIGHRVAAIGMWTSVVALALLSFFSAVVTYSNGWGYRLNERLLHSDILNAPVMIAVALFSCVCIAGFVYALSAVLSRRGVDKRVVLLVVCVLAGAFQLWWVLVQHADGSYYADSSMVMSMAEKLANGDMSIFDERVDGLSIADMRAGTQYLFYYPYQSGIVSFFSIMFKAFGDKAPFAIQVANIISNLGSIVTLSFVGFLATDSERARVAIPVAVGACVPSLLYSSFLYGNQIGFFFATVFVAMNARALGRTVPAPRRAALVLLSAIPMSLMMVIKSTFVVIAIAVAIVWLIELLLHLGIKNAVCLASFVVALLVSVAAGKLPQAYLENVLGYSFGQGMPKTAWIAMGLQNDSVLSGMPGWWNGGALERQGETGNDYDSQVADAASDIIAEVKRMCGDPRYAAWFFAKKLGSEWLTPDFQSRYFAGINYEEVDGNPDDRRQFNLTERDYDVTDERALATERAIDQVDELMPFMDGYQTLVYVGAFASCLAIARRSLANRDGAGTVQLLLPCIFVIGAAVYVLWEAKAQYLLPFFMCLTPVAVPDLIGIGDRVARWLHATDTN